MGPAEQSTSETQHLHFYFSVSLTPPAILAEDLSSWEVTPFDRYEGGWARMRSRHDVWTQPTTGCPTISPFRASMGHDLS